MAHGRRRGVLLAPGPTTTVPHTTATSGWRCNTDAARATEPGVHTVSPSHSATTGASDTRTPRLRPDAPRCTAERTTRAAGSAARSDSAVPSVDPLSTTMTSGSSGRASAAATVRSASAHRLYVMTTSDVGSGDS